MRDVEGDPGLEPTARCGPRGPYVGAEPLAEGARFAREATLDELLRELSAGFGRQHWWPAQTPFEVLAGAVLVQNTAWRNVEHALRGLARSVGIAPAAILSARAEDVLAAIRPSGTYRVKYERLCAVARWYLDAGGLAALRERPLEPLRRELLGVRGIGPETADAILCYAAARPTFVVDTYARRVVSRHGLAAADLGYEELRRWFQERLEPEVAVYQEAHALFVRAGYDHCKPRAACETCPATTPDPGSRPGTERGSRGVESDAWGAPGPRAGSASDAPGTGSGRRRRGTQ